MDTSKLKNAQLKELSRTRARWWRRGTITKVDGEHQFEDIKFA